MLINVTRVADVLILRLSGRLLISSAEFFRHSLNEHVSRGDRKVLIDTRGISTLDSMGVLELTKGYELLHAQGGALKLLLPIGKVRDILEIMRLVGVFETFETEEEAVRSFE